MKAALLAFLVAISVSTWSYNKLQDHTGYGNTATTLKGAALVFFVTIIVVFTIGQIIFH